MIILLHICNCICNLYNSEFLMPVVFRVKEIFLGFFFDLFKEACPPPPVPPIFTVTVFYCGS